MQEQEGYHQRKGSRIRMAGKDQASMVQGELLEGQGGKAMVSGRNRIMPVVFTKEQQK